jgi:hypothetical protein
MKNKWFSASLVIACVVSLSGFVFAAACPTGTMMDYIGTGFTCTIANPNNPNDVKTFSNWFYQGTANPPNFALPPGSVGVVPQTQAFDPGFRFSAPWSVSTMSGVLSMNSDIDYGVTVTGGLITDVSLAIGGYNFSGTGSVQVDESLCIGALFAANGSCSGREAHLHVYDNGSGLVAFNEITFAGVTQVGVEKDILVDAGTNGGAALSLVFNNVSEQGTTPEPASILLFGSGALALAGVLRRKLKH